MYHRAPSTEGSLKFDGQVFLEKFALLSETPGAIEKLRSLILNLAFKGLLVDEPDAENNFEPSLLEAIDADVEMLAGKKRSNSQKKMVVPEVWPNTLPASWRWTVLGRIANWGSGSTPKRGNPEFYGGKITWLKSGELNDVRGLAGSEEQITDKAIEKCSFRLNQAGDVLFAMYGATVGKVAILGETAVTNQAVCGCTPSKYVLNSFLYYYLISQRQKFRDSSEGGAQPNFSKDKIVSFPFPLPPLAEQKRIVAKVDELMGLCDRLEAEQAERQTRHAALSRAALAHFADEPTVENLRFLFHESFDVSPAELRESILSMAVQGRLASQSPEDEPAQKAIECLESLGGNPKLRRSVPERVRKPEGLDESNLPKTWAIESTARLLRSGVLSDLKDGNHGANHPKVAEFTETGLPFITAAQVSDRGKIDYEGAYKVSGEALDRLRVGFAKNGDVIYTHKGSVGRVGICDRDCVLTPQTTYYRVNEDVLTADFLRIYLLSPQFRSQVDVVKRQTTRDFVSIKAQYQFFIRVPPLGEQLRIVHNVKRLMALVDDLEQHLTESQIKAEQLMEAVVAELVRQN